MNSVWRLRTKHSSQTRFEEGGGPEAALPINTYILKERSPLAKIIPACSCDFPRAPKGQTKRAELRGSARVESQLTLFGSGSCSGFHTSLKGPVISRRWLLLSTFAGPGLRPPAGALGAPRRILVLQDFVTLSSFAGVAPEVCLCTPLRGLR